MKRVALCSLVAVTLLAPQPSRAQSCFSQSFSSCIHYFGRGWLPTVFAGYCGLVRVFLCDVGY
jgi:hypothetical protein